MPVAPVGGHVDGRVRFGATLSPRSAHHQERDDESYPD
jgi:hypothetical protein